LPSTCRSTLSCHRRCRGTEFLGDSARNRRIKAKRLRGVYSEGLLLPLHTLPWGRDDLPTNVSVETGLDCRPLLGIVKYEDSVPAMLGGGPRTERPQHRDRTEARQRSRVRHRAVQAQPLAAAAGDRVVITEKLHGTQVRYLLSDGKVHVGSHRVWWKDDHRLFALLRGWWRRLTKKSPLPANLYWKVAREEDLAELAKEEPGADGLVFYGEIYGDVQDLKYSHETGQQSFRVFDIYCQ
jgi:RNA ligase (TIGR02306 family)